MKKSIIGILLSSLVILSFFGCDKISSPGPKGILNKYLDASIFSYNIYATFGSSKLTLKENKGTPENITLEVIEVTEEEYNDGVNRC